MKFVYIICLLFSSIMFSQSKAIVPKQGAIVFKKVDTITDVEKYIISMVKLTSKMIDAQMKNIIERELVENQMQLNTDSTQINEMKQVMKNMIEESVMQDIDNKAIDNKDIKYHQLFKNQLVVKFQTLNDVIFENYNVINIQKNTSKTLESDSITIVSENIEYQYSKNEVLEIKEFKNETKKINGFKCFKVIMLFKPYYNEEDEFENFINQYVHKRELWVTDKIKCSYHPIENQKEIITKYYPLEITESIVGIEGQLVNFSIVSLSIN